MNAKDLIGKVALREKPIEKEMIIGTGFSFGGEKMVMVHDYAYCTEPVKIIAASDHHVVIEETIENVFTREGPASKQVILDERFCDNNWTSYDDLVSKNEEGSHGG